MLARTWGSLLVSGGMLGHINAESQLDDWHFGQAILQQLAEMANSPLPKTVSDPLVLIIFRLSK